MSLLNTTRKIGVWLAGAGLLLAAFAQAWAASNTGSTALALRVAPEARVSPASVPLAFEVTGAGDAGTLPVTVEAWFRALPNQQTRLNARSTGLTGEGGDVIASPVAWDAASISGTGGGAVNCSASSEASGVVCRWGAPGTARIRVTFSVPAGSLQAGRYTGRVDFSLDAQ